MSAPENTPLDDGLFARGNLLIPCCHKRAASNLGHDVQAWCRQPLDATTTLTTCDLKITHKGMNIVRRYRTEDGREVVTEWLASLRTFEHALESRPGSTDSRLATWVTPNRSGMASQSCAWIWARVSRLLRRRGLPGVLLLCGGDIDRAVAYLADFKRRVNVKREKSEQGQRKP